MKGAKRIAEYKKNAVEQMVKYFQQYPIIGALNMQNMPAPQLQNMRAQLRADVVILMSKKRLIKIAIEKAKEKVKGLDELKKYLEGMPAFLFTKENPFKLFRIVEKNKSRAPAKGGQVAPYDIIVPKGATPFAPGPVISELGSVKIKTGVEGGKVTIREDSMVAKKGEVISAKLASVLTRLDILPMEIGLDIVAVLENGIVYGKDVLSIDEAKFMENLATAASWAFNLSVEAAYPTKENIELMICKSFGESKAVALEANFMADAVAEELVAKAEREMLSLKEIAKIEVHAKPAEAKHEHKEEPKKEHAAHEHQHEETKPKIDRTIQDLKEDVKKETAEIKKEVEELRKKEEAEPMPAAKPGPFPEKITPAKIQEVKPADDTEKDIVKRMDAEIERLDKEFKEDLKEAEQKVKELPRQEAKEAKKVIEEVKTAVKDIIKEEKAAKQDAPKLGEIKKHAEKQPNFDSEKLFEELKKKGTLRGVNAEEKKRPAVFTEPPTGDQLRALAKKPLAETKKKEAEHVPSAHELAEKRKKKVQS